MALKDIFCQDRAIGILQRALAVERSAHAYIFAGLEGVGKYATARQWAKLLLCENPARVGTPAEPFVDSCGACDACVLFETDAHPDFSHVYKELREFTRDGKGKPPPLDMPIDVVREFLLEKASIRPTHSARKVFVVSEAEKLNASSQNALLKVLEEPPSSCTIILLCTRIERLLPTTKSRCQTIRFGPIDEGRIVKALTGMGLSRDPAQFFARLAQGSLGLACQWAALEREGAGLFETKRNVVASLARFALADALDLADQILGQAKEVAATWASLDKTVSKSDLSRRAQKTLIAVILSACHDAMLINICPGHALIHADQQREITRLADRIDPESAAVKIREGYEALRWIDANVNDKLIFERLLLRLVPSAIIASGR
jgi:DNA polymerase III subunit delta'